MLALYGRYLVARSQDNAIIVVGVRKSTTATTIVQLKQQLTIEQMLK